MSVEVGDEAPDFELRDQHGQPVRLSDYRDRKHVVVLFYRYAFSRVCTGELCGLRDDLGAYQNDDVQLLAVSVDSTFTNRAYAAKEGYEFPLLADFWPHGGVAQAYGVFDERIGAAIRGTFIVDKHGIVRWRTVNAVPDARDQDAYREALAALD